MELNNIILTCGTSLLYNLRQLETHESTQFRYSLVELYRNLNISNQDMSPGVDYGSDPFVQQWVEEILACYRHHSRDLVDLCSTLQDGSSGPFGVELSALAMLKKRQEGRLWANRRDRIVLLVPNSMGGLLSGMVLQAALVEFCQTPAKLIEMIPITGMHENPVDMAAVLKALATAVTNQLCPQTHKTAWSNILLAASAYRYCLPCLTAISVMYGVELIYAVDSSNRLHSLHSDWEAGAGQAGTTEKMEKSEPPDYLAIITKSRHQSASHKF